MLANGRMVKYRAMEYIHGKTETDMKESGKTVLSMVKALIFLLMEMFILVLILQENPMDLDLTLGVTGQLMLESSERGLRMAKENGKKIKVLTVIHIREHLRLI